MLTSETEALVIPPNSALEQFRMWRIQSSTHYPIPCRRRRRAACSRGRRRRRLQSTRPPPLQTFCPNGNFQAIDPRTIPFQ